MNTRGKSVLKILTSAIALAAIMAAWTVGLFRLLMVIPDEKRAMVAWLAFGAVVGFLAVRRLIASRTKSRSQSKNTSGWLGFSKHFWSLWLGAAAFVSLFIWMITWRGHRTEVILTVYDCTVSDAKFGKTPVRLHNGLNIIYIPPGKQVFDGLIDGKRYTREINIPTGEGYMAIGSKPHPYVSDAD